MRIGIIGGGMSGVATARVLAQLGHEVAVFERGSVAGGVWSVAYPDVRLQNTRDQYRFADFPWPFPVDLHPTREQILRYVEAAIAHFRLDVRAHHTVLSMRDDERGWQLEVESKAGRERHRFDYVVIAAGQYTGEKSSPTLTGNFAGKVITDRDVDDLAMLEGREVAVVGFGKSAVDMAAFAAERGSRVHHVFREPRWLLPKHILGVHATRLMFARMSTAMIPAWVHASPAEQFLHDRLPPLVNGFWSIMERIVRLQTGMHERWKDEGVKRRMALLTPRESVHYQMRSALALAPDRYYPLVIEGRIEPHRGEVARFGERSLVLTDGREIPCDLVIFSTGFKPPRFPYLNDQYRALLENEPDGAQLYRHLIHPRIPRVAFAGYNHGFFHVPGVEIAAIWLSAVLRGDLVLPPPGEMERRIEEIREWKRANSLFEPSRSCAVNTRFHQYFDVMLGDLGLSPFRKSNPIAEALSAYSASDYDGLIDEYERTRYSLTLPRKPLPLST